MLRLLRSVFGDPSRDALIASAKEALTSPNAPIQEQAAAIERLSSVADAESQVLVLKFATNSRVHEWLQQVAGEAVAEMLEGNALDVSQAQNLTRTAAEAVVAILSLSQEERLQRFATQLQVASLGFTSALSKQGQSEA